MAKAKLETYKTMMYAITFTLKPHIYRHNIDKQIELAMEEINQFISYTKAEGLLTTEVTKNANVHFHSALIMNVQEKYKTKLDFMIKDYFRKAKIIGFLVIKPVLDEIGWLQYMLKDYDKTLDILKDFDYKSPILFNRKIRQEEFDIFPKYYTKEEIIQNKNIDNKATLSEGAQ